MNSEEILNELCYQKLSSLGAFFPLEIEFDGDMLRSELHQIQPSWIPYNKSKQWSHRYGLSLYSLEGEVSGEIDLNSIREWNSKHGTKYNEMNFRCPTKYWRALNSISKPLEDISPFFGRTHLLKLDEGGIFPPHRDNYGKSAPSFRLVSFFNCCPESLHLTINGERAHFLENRCYFMDTRKVHSLVSFQPESLILVVNVSICRETERLIIKKLLNK